jgi:undecaprenyl-diphosphatase
MLDPVEHERPSAPRSERPSPSLTRAILFCASLAAFFALALLVEWRPPPADDGTIVALARLRTPASVRVARVATGLGGGKEVAALAVVAVLGLAWLRRARAAVFLAAVVGGSSLLNGLAKWIVARPRPSIVPPAYHPSGLSFPSGHSMASFALYVGLWLVAREERSPHARILLAFALVAIPMVGFTRMFLGVHFPTDVLAGWSLSTAWIVLAHAWYARPARC